MFELKDSDISSKISYKTYAWVTSTVQNLIITRLLKYREKQKQNRKKIDKAIRHNARCPQDGAKRVFTDI